MNVVETHEKSPCCFFPTTVVLIDDNSNFLNLIFAKIIKNLPCISFMDSTEALNFLNTKGKKDNFSDKWLTYQEDDAINHSNVDINISKIHYEIYNFQRFSTIAVLVVDYDMPGLNGAELCQALQGSGYRTILLTGKAGLETAVELFNTNTINCYINKNDPHFIDKLLDAINGFQKEYFLKISEFIVNSLTVKNKLLGDNQFFCLDDPVFIDFFNGLLLKKDIREYYLLDESGSFLFLNATGKLSWLIVKNEEQMAATEYEMGFKSVKISDELHEKIKNRSVLRHWFNNDDYPDPEKIEEAANLFYPATKLVGRSNYYYSYIEKPLMMPDIDTNKIVSYDKYRLENR
ncbi:MAG TPA: response regulator [Gammaproteobacteria bacterium]|jgi:CheY-like chemotaxis protein|nr:response regulator [Gammaproteobacteria bacterium]